ncbi:MAG: phosphoribosylformylglycinamidine synthase subunit PurL [Acidobacteriota bacterium]
MTASLREPEVTPALARDHGLSDEEYGRILAILGRTPTFTELGIFSVMWSEHCSYKSSKVHLRRLPTASPRLLQGPGENAGAVDIGHGLAAVFKIESHNHPSFVEPYQGAATGVGGILRDIFTMGARPIASCNSLRFGALDHPKTRRLLKGVVAGIAGYGNCMGIPTVGGEVSFDACYNGNILVNVFNIGIAESARIFRAKASGVGNPVIYVGSKTGKDGIHGASLLASAEFDERSEEMRPTVQVGDPFMEKLLLEACLEAMRTGAIVAIQDMGAAGLTCSATEMSAKGDVGMELDLDLVPKRETGMSSYELMLSESQERMLLVAEKGREEEILSVFRKWDVDAAVVGTIVEGRRVRITYQGRVVADVPGSELADKPPIYERPMSPPRSRRLPVALEALPAIADLGAALLALASHPELASKSWIWTQYDHMVGSDTVIRPGGDAAVLRVKGTPVGLAVSVDGNSHYGILDPYEGAAIAVCEAARNVAATGARPIGLTDGMNFGNPEKPEVMGQFSAAIDGIRDAALALSVPVTGGNCSFYNETEGQGIHPTPIIGMVGLLPDVRKAVGSFFTASGLSIWLLGTTRIELGGSAYERLLAKTHAGPPPRARLDDERALCDLLVEGADLGLLRAAHDLSIGGLLFGLLRACAGAELFGADVDVAAISDEARSDLALLSESQGRAIVAVADDDAMADLAERRGVPAFRLGVTGGSALRIRRAGATLLDRELSEVVSRYRKGFEEWIAS